MFYGFGIGSVSLRSDPYLFFRVGSESVCLGSDPGFSRASDPYNILPDPQPRFCIYRKPTNLSGDLSMRVIGFPLHRKIF